MRLAAQEGVGLSALSLDELKGLSDLFTADVAEVFNFAASVARRSTFGGTAPDAVRVQLQAAQDWLALHSAGLIL